MGVTIEYFKELHKYLMRVSKMAKSEIGQRPWRPSLLKRNYDAAKGGNLYGWWSGVNQTSDAELFGQLQTIRGRSRELSRNNDYMKKFIGLTKTNVIGNEGIRLQSLVMNNRKKPDRAARREIEAAYKAWQKKGVCDVTGKYSYHDVQNLAISSAARDGEILFRRIYSRDFEFGYKLQLIEADHLDENYNEVLPNGNIIRMSVESDAFGAPVAYHLWPNHPGDFRFGASGNNQRVRVPAAEIIHLFVPVRVSQSRGVPWGHTAMTRMNQLDAYEEGELVASRLAANKTGMYSSPDGANYRGESKTSEGGPVQESEPGTFEVLPPGWEFQPIDWQHPKSQFGEFTKTILRGIAAGLGVSYNMLANDLEHVNFSSIRAGVLDERDIWRMLQRWFIDHFSRIVFEDWLEAAILTGRVAGSISSIEKFKAGRFLGRGWAWVDPVKDVQSAIMEIENGLNTSSEVVAKRSGDDLENVYRRIEEEEKLRKEFGIKAAFEKD